MLTQELLKDSSETLRDLFEARSDVFEIESSSSEMPFSSFRCVVESTDPRRELCQERSKCLDSVTRVSGTVNIGVRGRQYLLLDYHERR